MDSPRGGGINVADQQTLYNTMRRRATGSQEAAAKRQKMIVFALVGVLFLAIGVFKFLSNSPVAPQNGSPTASAAP